MESYTFRCGNEECENVGKLEHGWTMSKAVAVGLPICDRCGNFLTLVGSDESLATDLAKVSAAVRQHRCNQPGAYYEVPRGPVNPPIGG